MSSINLLAAPSAQGDLLQVLRLKGKTIYCYYTMKVFDTEKLDSIIYSFLHFLLGRKL